MSQAQSRPVLSMSEDSSTLCSPCTPQRRRRLQVVEVSDDEDDLPPTYEEAVGSPSPATNVATRGGTAMRATPRRGRPRQVASQVTPVPRRSHNVASPATPRQDRTTPSWPPSSPATLTTPVRPPTTVPVQRALVQRVPPSDHLSTCRSPAAYFSGPRPHPSTLNPPPSGTAVEAYYLVSIGQRVGIFFDWDTVLSLTDGVPGSSVQPYGTWDAAFSRYRVYHVNNFLDCRILVGGAYDTEDVVLFSVEELAEYAEGMTLNPEEDLL
ncbi:hypothetical protein H0H92_015319 [Tricholoma furcatifolium]|nr:hypothetical protein H0H92_015319 [Tricholoma furcatifolium]